MKLADYLAQRKLSQAQFGRQIKKPQPTIGRYVSGERIPEPDVMEKIFKVTDGLVTPNDFYNLNPAAVL